MDSSSKFFFSFSVNYVMIVKLVDLIVLLGSKLLNRFRKFFNRLPMDNPLLGFGTVKINPGLCELDKNRPCVVCLNC